MQIEFRSLTEVTRQFGYQKTKIFADKSAGLFPQTVKISRRCVRWIQAELDEFAAARASGANDEQLRGLVREQVARRAGLMPRLTNAAA